MTDSKQKFTATFTLSQEGTDGDVTSSLTFEPLVSDEEVLAGHTPDAYDIMAYLVQHYLQIAGIVDEEGDIVDPDGYENNTHIHVRQSSFRGSLN